MNTEKFIEELKQNLESASLLLDKIADLIKSRPGLFQNYVKKSHIKYIDIEYFNRLVNKLSLRNHLIAKIAYHLDMKINDILELKKEKLHDLRENHINMPSDLFTDLQLWEKICRNTDCHTELLFFNHKGLKVQRAHLNQAFARASQAAGLESSITPGMLNRYKEIT